MSKLIIVVTILLILPTILIYWFINHRRKNTWVRINGVPLVVEIADSQEKRIQGLSGRSSLPSDRGLLFIYEKPDYYSIWMKEMNFPLDIIWINKERRIVDLAKDVKPETFPQAFTPQTPALYILETNSGFCEKNKIMIGDAVSFGGVFLRWIE